MAGLRAGSPPYVRGAASHLFVDRFGTAHELDPRHRSLIKPGWQRVFRGADRADPGGESLERLDEMAARLRLGAGLLAAVGCDLRGTRVLDVGCGDGAETFLLARCGPAEVVGTNHGDLLLERQGDRGRGQERLRDEIGRAVRRGRFEPVGPGSHEAAAVSFVEDDIAASALETASFDVVCSWETLEHLTEPAAAFAEMHRLLRPGGYAFHEYNPFFCIEGGHSLCTLDLPWGHVRLGAEDFERYVASRRPEEAALAVDYYHRGLNRLSLDGTMACGREAGFEILCFVPRARTEDLLALSRPILEQARRVYPHLTVNDLVCRMARLVLRKPPARDAE